MNNPRPSDDTEIDEISNLLTQFDVNMSAAYALEDGSSGGREASHIAIMNARNEAKAKLQALLLRGKIQEIMDLVIASGSYPVDRAYSREPFYCVDKPEADKRLADLRRELHALEEGKE